MRVRAVRTALGPVGAWWLKERVLGQLPVLTGHTVVSAEAAGNRLRLRVKRSDGRVIDQTTEHLIAGTGYRMDLGRLPFLGDQLRGRLPLVAGAPALSCSFEASAPDLYFVGLASAHSFGRSCGFSTARTTAPAASSVTSCPGPPGHRPWAGRATTHGAVSSICPVGWRDGDVGRTTDQDKASVL
jgi:FAD-dependent urate hydroxylase